MTYLLLRARDLFEEVHVDDVNLGQVRLALLCQECEHVLLGLHLLHELAHVDLLHSLLRWVLLHHGDCEYYSERLILKFISGLPLHLITARVVHNMLPVEVT